MLLTGCIHGRGHAANDLPRAVRSSPRVRDPQSVGPNFGACAVRPRCAYSIVIDRAVARNLNRELLDLVGLKSDAFGRVRRDPIGDVIFPHRRRTDKWPPNEIVVPHCPIFLQVIGFHVVPVRLFRLPDLRFALP